MTNGHNPAMGLVSANGQPLVVNQKLRHVRVVYLAVPWLGAVMRMDGTKALRVTGLPFDAELVGNTPVAMGTDGQPLIGLIYYHPSFPIVLEGQAPAPLALQIEELTLDEAIALRPNPWIGPTFVDDDDPEDRRR